jgi:hypothetical protein
MKTTIDARELKVGDMLDRGAIFPREVVRVRQATMDAAGVTVHVTEVLHRHPEDHSRLVVANFARGSKAAIFTNK